MPRGSAPQTVAASSKESVETSWDRNGSAGSAKPKKGGGSGNFLGRASRNSRFSHSTQLYIMKRGGPYYAP